MHIHTLGYRIIYIHTHIHTDLNAASFGIVSTTVSDGPNKIFIGGIPNHVGEDSLKDILSSFGKLKAFNLVRDPGSTLSKGYAFCEYADTAVTAPAIEALNGFQLLDKQLTVKVANANATVATVKPVTPVQVLPTNVVLLRNMVSAEEVNDDVEYQDIIEDVRGECSQYGKVVKILIPRSKEGFPVEIEGNIYLQFETIMDAAAAANALGGRKFADKTCQCDFFPLEKFMANQLI